MSIAENLDDLIGRLEKAQSAGGLPPSTVTDPAKLCDCGKTVNDCECVKKGDDCGCKSRKRLVKGDVQDQAFCKKCRGELGKCECMRKGVGTGICNDCGLPADECECEAAKEVVAKSGLDALIDVLSKQVD